MTFEDYHALSQMPREVAGEFVKLLWSEAHEQRQYDRVMVRECQLPFSMDALTFNHVERWTHGAGGGRRRLPLPACD